MSNILVEREKFEKWVSSAKSEIFRLPKSKNHAADEQNFQVLLRVGDRSSGIDCEWIKDGLRKLYSINDGLKLNRHWWCDFIKLIESFWAGLRGTDKAVLFGGRIGNRLKKKKKDEIDASWRSYLYDFESHNVRVFQYLERQCSKVFEEYASLPKGSDRYPEWFMFSFLRTLVMDWESCIVQPMGLDVAPSGQKAQGGQSSPLEKPTPIVGQPSEDLRQEQKIDEAVEQKQEEKHGEIIALAPGIFQNAELMQLYLGSYSLFFSENLGGPDFESCQESCKSAIDMIAAVRKTMQRPIQKLLLTLEGVTFDSIEHRREIAERINTIAAEIGQRFRCTTCGEPASFKWSKSGNTKLGLFGFAHGGKRTHTVGSTIPVLALVDPPENLRKKKKSEKEVDSSQSNP